jgi:hypothetical protein
MSGRPTTINRRRTTRNLAHEHNQHAIHHDGEAAKLNAEPCDTLATPASEQGARKKSAA